jgi:hypothetical protein
MKRIIILSLLFVCSGAAIQAAGFGKKKTEQGYVVTTENDTIKGLISIVDDVESCLKVTISVNKGEKTTYDASKVKYYKRGEEEFISFYDEKRLNVYGIWLFIKLVKKDYLSVYELTYTRETFHGPEAKNDINQVFIILIDGKLPLIVFDNQYYKHKVSEYLSENEDLSNRIKNQYLKYSNFWETVEKFNTWKKTQAEK